MKVPGCRLLVLAALLMGCAEAEAPAPGLPALPDSAEAVSLRGEPLYRLAFAPARKAQLEADLAAARARYGQDSTSAEHAIWVGRRLGYLTRYQEALAVYSRALVRHPDEPRLYRHRGHRYLSVRALGRAVEDLERAAALVAGTEDAVEPDGQPNAAGIPTSTLHTNIYYHLGLAYFLQGRFGEARDAFQQCLAAAHTDDMRVATLDWLYMTLRRLGRPDEARALLAPIHPEMALLENFAYHRRLLLYKGLLPPDSLLAIDATADDRALTLATQGFGVGHYYLVEGEPERAYALFRDVLATGYWPAFGYLAAEAELHRAGK